VAYRRCEPAPGFREAVETCLGATGLDEAPFCAERQRHDGGWTLIELQARPGEDPGLEQAMWDAPVLDLIEEAALHAPSPRAG
jgi:hypothetical protein